MKISDTLAGGMSVTEAAKVARARTALLRQELAGHIAALPTLTGLAQDMTAQRIEALEGVLR